MSIAELRLARRREIAANINKPAIDAFQELNNLEVDQEKFNGEVQEREDGLHIVMRLSGEEVVALAFPQIRELGRRLGIDRNDTAIVDVTLFQDSPVPIFEWTLQPQMLTQDKIGITFRYNLGEPEVEVYFSDPRVGKMAAYVVGDGIYGDSANIGDRAKEVLAYYAVRVEQDTDEPMDPEMVELYAAACYWTINLINTRLKSE